MTRNIQATQLVAVHICTVWGATLLVLALLVAPRSAFAQEDPGGGGGGDCATSCLFCQGSPNHWVGGAGCTYCHAQYWSGYCAEVTCMGCSALSTGEDSSTMALVDLVTRSTREGLKALVAEHGDRLLVHANRRLVVVQGETCGGVAPQSVVFLDRELIDELVRLRVRSLAVYLAEARDRAALAQIASRQ